MIFSGFIAKYPLIFFIPREEVIPFKINPEERKTQGHVANANYKKPSEESKLIQYSKLLSEELKPGFWDWKKLTWAMLIFEKSGKNQNQLKA